MKKELGVVVMGVAMFGATMVKADTNVSGHITVNTVWDTTGSPYIVTGDVTVDSGVTLTIEPGVVVMLDSAKSIMVNGTLNAIGSVADSIIISAQDTTQKWQRIWFKSASRCSLKYCRIEYARNSAIYNEGTGPIYIEHNTISNNSGSSIYNNGGSATIVNNTISNNSAASGGGIYNDGGTTVIVDNTISNNSAASGGGIYNDGGTAVINSNTISNNSAASGGGLYCSGGSPTTMVGNTFTDNSAAEGGAIYNSVDSPTTIGGSSFTDNCASANGGAVYCSGGSFATFTNCEFIRNSATQYGGGIFSDSGLLVITISTFTGNSALDYGGGIFSSEGSLTLNGNMFPNNYAKYGGAIFSYKDTLKMCHNSFTCNRANYGGAAYCSNPGGGKGSSTIDSNTFIGNFVTDYGGAIYSSGGSPMITGNTITGDSAARGGGIYSDTGSPTITGNTISSNYTQYGGGIFSSGGSPTITGNTISGNSATQYGSGIYSYVGSPTITGNTITGNSADARGGGIYSRNGTPTITGNTISDNSATTYGGSIFSYYGSPTIKYNTIKDTTSSQISAIWICYDSALIDSNNLYATGYAVYNNSIKNINAWYNYWGTADSATIANQKIWDKYDNSAKGIVYYMPFLTDTCRFDSVEIEETENRGQKAENRLEVYPNPSVRSVIIGYQLPVAGEISLKLYDISGSLVRTLYSGVKEKGYHELNVVASCNTPLSEAGIYFIRLERDGFKETRKLTIIK
ncbi:MAG: right-handed parallel beta-helix repeat-containing protein [Candidatus Stahlbacteria bacterium]|nr:right-handed parallel beta-helix repeat-containing protein [Candidatus Stahlbacteria bacterium]